MSAALEAIRAEVDLLSVQYKVQIALLEAAIAAAQPSGEVIELREQGVLLGPLPDHAALPPLPARPQHPDRDTELALSLLEEDVWPAYMPADRLRVLVEADSPIAIRHSFWSSENQAYTVRVAPDPGDVRDTLKVLFHEAAHCILGHLAKHGRSTAHLENTEIVAEHTKKHALLEALDPADQAPLRALIARNEAEAEAWAEAVYTRLFEQAA